VEKDLCLNLKVAATSQLMVALESQDKQAAKQGEIHKVKKCLLKQKGENIGNRPWEKKKNQFKEVLWLSIHGMDYC